jgi:prepilin-type N-terminal cleavage/methylation domain-containing protein
MRKKRGFSIVEVLVSAVIFSLVMVGLMSVFIAGNNHIVHARERMTSVQLGKFFIDPLQMNVRQDTWGAGNELAVDGTRSGVTQIINNRSFTESHVVSAVTGTDLRRVTSTISWTE